MKIKLILLFFFIFLFIGIGYLYQQIFIPYSIEQTQINIPRGAGFSQINGLLKKNKIIKNPRLFHRYAQFKNATNSLQAGHYTFPITVSLHQVLTILIHGSKDFIKVTIPEGKNIYEIAHILKDNKIINSSEDFIKEALKKPDQSLNLPSEAPHLEGYLYPETYYFSPSTSVHEVIYNMVFTFNKETENLKKKAQRISHLSWHEIITLASIVEKETGQASERKKISGVFHNRLKKRMRLQSDPTTIYGIYPQFDGNLRKKDLMTHTPYNTYKIKALPPGPIAGSGKAAIKAAINPENHSYLYFVSNNKGVHIFSKTYKEHREAVNFYQKRGGR